MDRTPLPTRCADSFAGEHPGFEVVWNRGKEEGWHWRRPNSLEFIGPFNSSAAAYQDATRQHHHPDFL